MSVWTRASVSVGCVPHVILTSESGGRATLVRNQLNETYPFFIIIWFCEAIGIAATPGLLCQPRVIVKMIVEKQMECRLAEETEVLGENLLQRHFCPSQNPT
jgi:hypothetical protein